MQAADKQEKRSKRYAIIAGLTMVAITAIQFVAARFSLREHLTALDIASLRFAGAAVIFLPVIRSVGFEKLKALGWRRASVLALLVGFPYPAMINMGLTYAPAAHAAALCPASIVFFSFGLSRIVFNDRISNARIIGIAAIIAGLLFFVFPQGTENSGTLFGDMLFVGSGVMFSCYAVLVRRWAVDPVPATAAVVFLSCLPIPLIHAFTASGLGSASPTEIVVQVIIQGFLAGTAAMFLYTYAIRKLGPGVASLFMPCVPIAAAITGMVVLGEVPTLLQFFAIAVMTVGMILPTLWREVNPVAVKAG